jgi:hypothetical protein
MVMEVPLRICSPIIDSPWIFNTNVRPLPATMSAGTVIVSAVGSASRGFPAAIVPTSGRSSAVPLRSSASSIERFWFHTRRTNPFSTRCVMGLWTVATDVRPSVPPISSRLGE